MEPLIIVDFYERRYLIKPLFINFHVSIMHTFISGAYANSVSFCDIFEMQNDVCMTYYTDHFTTSIYFNRLTRILENTESTLHINILSMCTSPSYLQLQSHFVQKCLQQHPIPTWTLGPFLSNAGTPHPTPHTSCRSWCLSNLHDKSQALKSIMAVTILKHEGFS